MELYAIQKSTVLSHRYEILSLIGTGGFSLIYKAYDHEMNSFVAIKEFFPAQAAERLPYSCEVLTRNRDAAERFAAGLAEFKAEARRMAELNGLHNTVNVLGAFDENNTSYIVMELLEGRSLLEQLKSMPNGRFSDIEDAKQIIYSVAEALDYAHSKGILHRDVSPDNIFLCRDGKVKLLDFGAARELTEDGELSVVVKSGCTPPEQYRKNGKLGSYTDIYALGAVFYRMLTGVYPESAPDRSERRECTPPSEINPAVPEYINALIMRCLAYDHTLRISHASEVTDVLRREIVIPLPGAIRARNRTMKAAIGGMFFACLILFVLIGLIVLKKSESLYNIDIDECELRVQLPEYFSSESGLDAVLEDFGQLYPQIKLKFVSEAEEAEILLFSGDTDECAPLDELQKLCDSADEYSVLLAYDAAVIYLNVEKAFKLGLSVSDDIPTEYYADSFAEFLDGENPRCAYSGSVALYRSVQEALPGTYRLRPSGDELSPIRLAASAELSENTLNAALRFLLYLSSERAQELLFVNNGGLIPANEAQYLHFTEICDELAFLRLPAEK